MACSGACCAVFPLGGLTYAQLEERFHRLRDGATIFDMVRPLSHGQAVARAQEFTSREDLREGTAYYRCVRWDEATRLCTRYDERPELCTDYPYEHPCDHECGYTEPERVRFRWLAIRLRAPQEWWYDSLRWRWVRSVNVAPLTFPG